MRLPTYSISTELGTGRFLGMNQDPGGCWVPLSHIEAVCDEADSKERARIRRALMRAARAPISGLGSAIFAETQSKPRHLCNYEEVALSWLKNALNQICQKEPTR